MKEHRNSAQRFYVDGLPVFITTVTDKRVRFFEEDVFCKLFIETLDFTQKLKRFELIAYKINFDHIHLIILPDKAATYSEIMLTIKRNFSQDCNNLIAGKDFIRSDSHRRRFESSPVNDRGSLPIFEGSMKENFENHLSKLIDLRNEFLIKFPDNSPYGIFKWQKSFHVWLLKDEKTLFEKIEYIRYQCQHHTGTNENYLFIKQPL